MALLVTLVSCVEISQELRINHREFFRPEVVDKATVEELLDASAGAVEVSYLLTVEDVQVQDTDGAEITWIRVKNKRRRAITVQIKDTLYCDAGGGTLGSLVTEVYASGDVLIAAGDTFSAGPFPEVDATMCSDTDGDGIREVVNRVEVFSAGGAALLAAKDFGADASLPISGTVPGRLVDVEELPAGWGVDAVGVTGPESASLTIDESAAGSTYTTAFEPVGQGEYVLTKRLVRAGGTGCEPQVIENSAFMKELSPSATVFGDTHQAEVALTCGVPRGWGWKKATDPDDAMRFLNGTGAYGHPVEEARIGAFWTGGHREIYVFYRRGNASTRAGWGWKLATDPQDVHHFLNGSEGYSQPVGDAQICAMWRGSHREFYVFYRRPAAGEEVGSWGWKLAPEPSDAMDFLNGTGAYNRPVGTARIASLERGGAQEFYVFYQRAASDPGSGGWGWKRSTDIDDAYNFVNGEGAYGDPVEDFELGALWARGCCGEYFMFYR
jgi:hypothetical protein